MYALNNFKPNDVVVRYRSDMIWTIMPKLPKLIVNDVVYTVPFEGHENIPFEKNVLNDQFWYSRVATLRSLISNAFKQSETGQLEISRFALRTYFNRNRGVEGQLSDSAFQLNYKIFYVMGIYSFENRRSEEYKEFLKALSIKWNFIFFPVRKPSYLNLGFWVFFIPWKFKQQIKKACNWLKSKD